MTKLKAKRSMLVTTALPYANGPLHLGHMVEFIQADIWIRFQRLQNHRCYFICGDDAHGTPIMLKAESLNITPEALIQKIHQEHDKTLKTFHVEFDNFHTTHSHENRELANEIYQRLKKKGDITTHTIRQAYDPVKSMFLPDRYVKGECPKCGAADQYGDNCEVCGSTYSPTDLKNPISVISGATPIEKESLHYFFCLDHYASFLKEWTKQGHLQEEVAKKLEEWFTAGLKQWDISRDAPYFGFEIPDAPGKYFYVWLDAPIGYMASFKNYCDNYDKIADKIQNKNDNPQLNERIHIQEKPNFEEFWNENGKNESNKSEGNKTELFHFIGKDIVYFHALFWPSILKGSGYRTPSNIFVHGFLTVNGQKMSKSRGTFITADEYSKLLPPEYLRYYFACKLGGNIEDIDFQIEDFVNRINADLVGKFINIASRSAGFISKLSDGLLSNECVDKNIYQLFIDKGETIAKFYEEREYRQAIREIMQLTDEANRYIDEKKPWVLAKSKEKAQETQEVCSLAINLFRVLMIYLTPILPALTKKVEAFLNCRLTWESRLQPLCHHKIETFHPLISRIDLKEVSLMLNTPNSPETSGKSETRGNAVTNEKSETSKSSENSKGSETSDKTVEPLRPTISIDDFAKVDLRVAKVINAESVPDADKLIKLQLDLGFETREVFAGIKAAYPDPEQLIGRSVMVVANLAPRKMRFGTSYGMVLVAGPGGKDLWVVEPNSHANPGSSIR